jgi:sphingolipid delta-4 desaturase
MASVSHGPYIGRDDKDESGLRRRPLPSPPGPQATEASRWHVRRHHAILRDHPQLKRLFGVERTTSLWVVALGATQLALAYALRGAPWWLIFAVVLAVGAPITHALGVLIHECTHNLAFRTTWKNKLLAIVANIPLGAPAAIEFRHQHLLHHRYLGDTREPDGGDTQAPMAREIRVTGRSTWRKLVSFTVGRFFYGARRSNKAPVDAWLVANIVVCVGVSLAVLVALGPRALAYVLLSPLFGFGPHPLGARRIAEHVTLRAGQPTSSYYGAANLISFNVGHHVEHHDFPHVPWSRIGLVRAGAREHYDSLAVVHSWTGLLVAHFFDRGRHVGQYVGLSEDYIETDSTES